jgi:hypothetical protein
VTHDDESVTSELNTSLYSPGDAANIVEYSTKTMGFSSKRVWVMDY